MKAFQHLNLGKPLPPPLASATPHHEAAKKPAHPVHRKRPGEAQLSCPYPLTSLLPPVKWVAGLA